MGDWKLILGATSPNFWQGPKFPNSTSYDDIIGRGGGERAQLLEGQPGYGISYDLTSGPPPRPYPQLEPCMQGTDAAPQVWELNSNGRICTTDPVRTFQRLLDVCMSCFASSIPGTWDVVSHSPRLSRGMDVVSPLAFTAG
jgi:hypothetical protein